MELTRKELYDLVWSEPMTTICKRFGLSDNGLRKYSITFGSLFNIEKGSMSLSFHWGIGQN